MLHKQQHMVMTGTISRAPSQLLKGRNSEPPTPTAQVYASTWHTHTPASSLATTAPMWPQTCPTQRMNWSRRATTLCHLQDSLCCHSSAHREEMSWTPSYIHTYVRLYLHTYCTYVCTMWTLPSDFSVHADNDHTQAAGLTYSLPIQFHLASIVYVDCNNVCMYLYSGDCNYVHMYVCTNTLIRTYVRLYSESSVIRTSIIRILDYPHHKITLHVTYGLCNYRTNAHIYTVCQ